MATNATNYIQKNTTAFEYLTKALLKEKNARLVLETSINGKQEKLTGVSGQFVGFDENGNAIATVLGDTLPAGGELGQVLSKTENGYAWITVEIDAPTLEEVVSLISAHSIDPTAHEDLFDTKLNKVENASLNKYAAFDENGSLIAREMEYTAFEVFPHSEEIPQGALSGAYLEALKRSRSSYNIYQAIPACTTDAFYIRSNKNENEIDVVVDWGDGTITKLSTITPTAYSNGEYRYYLEHEYTTPDVKYIEKIYGKDYFGMIRSRDIPNILCRVFDKDLPIASHIINFSSFCRGSYLLFEVDCSWVSNSFLRGDNYSNLFMHCYNLVSATGFVFYNNKITLQQAFYACYQLETTDLRIPTNLYDNGLNSTYFKCYKLAVNIEDLLPLTSFVNPNLKFISTFSDCQLLTGTVPAKILWNNHDMNFTVSNPFLRARNLLSQIPESWGGTAPDSIIEKTLDEKLENLKAEMIGMITTISTSTQNS